MEKNIIIRIIDYCNLKNAFVKNTKMYIYIYNMSHMIKWQLYFILDLPLLISAFSNIPKFLSTDVVFLAIGLCSMRRVSADAKTVRQCGPHQMQTKNTLLKNEFLKSLE